VAKKTIKGPSFKEAQFKKGQSGNPKGRPPDVLGNQIRQLTAGELAEIANIIVKGNRDQLEQVANSNESSVLQVMVAKIASNIIMRGDMASLDILLNRLVGKVKEKVELTGANGGPQIIVSLPSNGREAKKS
jgi:hypothetical protein